MVRLCKQCLLKFNVSAGDLAFYDRMSPVFGGKKFAIPPPNYCSSCREQRRFAFRNEWSLYHSKCDLSGKPMISLYSEEKPYKVYEQSAWWSEQFDPLEYGREFDFSRPFFEQWYELSLLVPRVSIHNSKSENCDYTNYSAENRNCYMSVGAVENEDVLYSFRASNCRKIVDCYDSYKCELCYEITDCRELYGCKWCNQCHNSQNLIYCSFCSSCRDCFGCVNLRQKQFHIFNQPFSAHEYHTKVKELMENPEIAKSKFEEFRLTQPCPALDILSCESSSGDHLINCKNCSEVFVVKNSEECNHCSFGIGHTSCYDINYANHCELVLFSTNLVKDYNVIFANLAWYVTDSMYVTSCFNSSNLFGCIGLKKNQYCIFNRQYSQSDYEGLVPRIIEHMQSTGEWGEYFPPNYSPFAYNETAAQDYYPLTKEQVLALGWSWIDHKDKPIPNSNRPSSPAKGIGPKDEITKQIHSCSVTGKNFKITPQELNIYQQLEVPIPTKCPEQRRRERMDCRNPHKLFNRECSKCKKAILSSFADSRPERIYCEPCYLSLVYS